MSLSAIATRIRRAEQGFSMVVTMGAVSMLLVTSAAAVSTVGGDQAVGRADKDRKGAYAAAEAGLQVYVHKLLVDNTYWTKCQIPADGVNNFWNYNDSTNPASDPRTWKDLTDGEGDAANVTGRYTIESIPVPGKTACDPADPEGSMIPAGTPTFRIRVTGQAKTNGKPTGAKRSLIATFKRKSFLDYIYFTDFEVMDPDTYPSSLAKGSATRENPGLDIHTPATQRDIAAWGQDACSQYAYTQFEANKGEGKKNRKNQLFKGSGPNAGIKPASQSSYSSWSAGCAEIQFVSGDWIRGPFHTNDTPMICGSPKFGRNPSDLIEISGPADTSQTNPTSSWRNSTSSGCGSSVPDVNFESDPTPDPNLGVWKFNQKTLQMPTSNTSLKDEADAGYYFNGRTDLELTSSGVRVTGTTKSGTTYNNQMIPYPSNGVIYVDNTTGCSATYNTADPRDLTRGGCGIARVKGVYNQSLTIAAADDILLMGNITLASSAQAVLGLVSNNFIRLNHPIVEQTACGQQQNPTSLTNGAGSLSNPKIEAALLALKHSFIIDNWACGDPLGTLTIKGAIAQKFRGPVGTGNGKTAATGYLKDYQYDDRLRVRIPPSFIDPVQSAWGIQTYQEQAKVK